MDHFICKKNLCYGCESCAQICPNNAIVMQEDEDGFRYPQINQSLCTNCGLCQRACPSISLKTPNNQPIAFGGYHKNNTIRDKSTSGGAFTAIAEAFCDNNYVIFGAEAKGLKVYHNYITDINELDRFRKSKYSQSIINNSYQQVKKFLNDGKKVLFSGTPCQIAGLKTYLQQCEYKNLLTVEVVCEGVPSPHFMKNYEEYIINKYKSSIESIDYRYTNANSKKKPTSGKWDFEAMHITLKNKKTIIVDRWFNPFWYLWLNHLMSRPSCYECKFATRQRIADITLGDLWGVHLYCPELYGKNLGSSLIIANTFNGKSILSAAQKFLYGHYLDFDVALKYQSPMRNPIPYNINRELFLNDIKSLTYKSLCKKWYKKPSIRLLYKKYIWGNRQKVALANLYNNIFRRKNTMLNFTVGPVQSPKIVRNLGKENIPYFRTQEFSQIMFENENLMKTFTNAEQSSRVVFLTASGTASMEATISNTLSQNDNVIIVNGGGFGERFVELLKIYNIPHTEIKLQPGQALTQQHLDNLDGNKFTTFVVNLHETSTGVLYDINLISSFCRKHNLFLIVDAISSFLADEIDCSKNKIDVMITGSQKALACPPGISIIVLSSQALSRINNSTYKGMYLNLQSALKNGERGQTPFTPAVGILLQINKRLKSISKCGGVEAERQKIKNLANDFRSKIKDLPFEIPSESLSNAVTPLHPKNTSAYSIFLTLKDKYNIWVCPNGGSLKDTIFRVGHIGDLSIKDNNKLIKALKDMQKKNLL